MKVKIIYLQEQSSSDLEEEIEDYLNSLECGPLHSITPMQKDGTTKILLIVTGDADE